MSIKDAMIKSRAGRSGWVYFEKLDQILHRDKATEPAATSSLCKKKPYVFYLMEFYYCNLYVLST